MHRVQVRNALVFAVCRGELEEVESLVNDYGISYSPDFHEGYVLLFNAVLFGYKEVVKFLLKSGAKVNERVGHTDTPLHLAAWFGDSDFVKLLLDHKALIDVEDQQNETPLHVACQRGHENIVELLLDRGADPNAVRELPAVYDKKFAHVKIDQASYNAACQIGHRGFKEVLEYGAQLDGSTDHESLHLSSESECVARNTEEEGNVTPLHLAAEVGCLKMVELLLCKNARIDAPTTKFLTPLHLAIMYWHTDVAIMLLNWGADINKKDDSHCSPLYYALETKNLRLVSFILQLEPDFDTKINELVFDIITHDNVTYHEIVDDVIKHGFTPSHEDLNSSSLLQAAVQKGYTKMVKCLLSHGAKLDATKLNPTLLHLAVESGEKEMIKLFLDAGCDVNAKDEFGETPIFYSMNCDQECKFLENIQLLLDRGADLGLAPNLLRKAVSQQNIDACKLLIENGADVNVLDKNGKTPLHRAVPIKYDFCDPCKPVGGADVTNLLLDADWTSKTEYCFSQVNRGIPCREEGIVRILLDHGADVDSRADDDSTALHLACQRGHQDIVKVLLNNGASADALQVNGLTPLHVAAQQGHADIVETLLAFDADVDARGAANETALHHAVMGMHSDVVIILVEYGCDINVENSKGATALSLAILESPSCNFVHRAGLSKRRAAIIRALKMHAIKLKAAGFRVCEKNLCLLSNSASSQLYQQRCEMEICRMKLEKLHDNYILFDLIEKRRYPRLMRNKPLIKTLEAFAYGEFPVYETLLISCFNKNKKTLALLTVGGEWLNFVMKVSNVVNVKKLPIPPPDVLEEIVSNLSARDVKNLIHCGTSLKRQVSK